MEFEVQEDRAAPLTKLSDNVRAGGSEQLTPNFERAHYGGQRSRQGQGFFRSRDIQRSDNRILHLSENDQSPPASEVQSSLSLVDVPLRPSAKDPASSAVKKAPVQRRGSRVFRRGGQRLAFRGLGGTAGSVSVQRMEGQGFWASRSRIALADSP